MSGRGNNKVGPVLTAGELAEVAIDAIHEDNPDKNVDVENHHAYIRVETDKECILRRSTMEKNLGRPFRIGELETILGSFAGQIEVTEEHMRFFLKKEM